MYLFRPYPSLDNEARKLRNKTLVCLLPIRDGGRKEQTAQAKMKKIKATKLKRKLFELNNETIYHHFFGNSNIGNRADS